MTEPTDFNLFRQMLTIRSVEERLLELFSEGKLSGTVHTCIGQEACKIGTEDIVHRTRKANRRLNSAATGSNPVLSELIALE